MTDLLPKSIEDDRGLTVIFQKLRNRQLVYSESKKNVLKGFHYQTNPWCLKRIHVIKGRIFDVVVDMNKESTAFGRWFGEVVEAPAVIYCEIGQAHGYLALEDSAILYEFIPFWHYPSTVSLLWNDPKLNVPWYDYANPRDFIISNRDINGLPWEEIIKKELFMDLRA